MIPSPGGSRAVQRLTKEQCEHQRRSQERETESHKAKGQPFNGQQRHCAVGLGCHADPVLGAPHKPCMDYGCTKQPVGSYAQRPVQWQPRRCMGVQQMAREQLGHHHRQRCECAQAPTHLQLRIEATLYRIDRSHQPGGHRQRRREPETRRITAHGIRQQNAVQTPGGQRHPKHHRPTQQRQRCGHQVTQGSCQAQPICKRGCTG